MPLNCLLSSVPYLYSRDMKKVTCRPSQSQLQRAWSWIKPSRVNPFTLACCVADTYGYHFRTFCSKNNTKQKLNCIHVLWTVTAEHILKWWHLVSLFLPIVKRKYTGKYDPLCFSEAHSFNYYTCSEWLYCLQVQTRKSTGCYVWTLSVPLCSSEMSSQFVWFLANNEWTGRLPPFLFPCLCCVGKEGCQTKEFNSR